MSLPIYNAISFSKR